MSLQNPWADPRETPRAGPLSGENPSVQRDDLHRWASWVALGFAVAALIATPLSYWLYLDNREHVAVHYLFGDYVAGVLYPLVGAYLLRRRPDNRVGWVFAATSVIGINGFAGQYAVAASLHDLPLRDLAAWISAWAWAPELAVAALLPLLFPDGTLASRRWRPVAVAALTGLSLAMVGMAFSHHPIDATDTIDNPWALPHSTWLLYLSRAGLLLVFASTLAGFVSLVLRMRSARGPIRAQLQWLMLSVLVTIGLALSAFAVPGTANEVVWGVAMAAIPTGVVIAVVRHRMLDIELVLNRALVYAILTGIVVVAYVAAVSVVGDVAAKKLGIAAVAVVALLVAAARDRLQRAVEHALFGDRHNPYSVVDRLGRRVDAASGPLDALEQMAAELRSALRLPYVGVLPVHDSLAAIRSGTATAGTVDVPITAHGAPIGVLQVGRRHAGEQLTAAEQSVLQDVARRAGALLQAAVLINDLRASRDGIVAAREEERRRLRHDLHDGVGPQLAGLALQLDSLARRLGDDEETAARVEVLRSRLRDTVVEVRRVVDNLRPPALDDVGLVEAVRQQVSAYSLAGAGHHAAPAALVDVVAAPLPPLPAAVEVAAYRIVTEAVANAVRHGRPQQCRVALDVTGTELVLSVSDDGSGIDADAVRGVGLTSMRERAAEVGGTFDLVTGPSGTAVTARLPLELT
jgi:signal transduction histidine kinase